MFYDREIEYPIISAYLLYLRFGDQYYINEQSRKKTWNVMLEYFLCILPCFVFDFLTFFDVSCLNNKESGESVVEV